MPGGISRTAGLDSAGSEKVEDRVARVRAGRLLLIAKNSIAQERAGALAVGAEAFELDFQHDGVVGVALVVVHVMAAEQAHRGAATVPFDAGEGVDGLPITQRIGVAADQLPR